MENPMDAKSNCYRREEPGLAVKPGINRVEKMSDAKLWERVIEFWPLDSTTRFDTLFSAFRLVSR
jgi:hypothetical protein